MDQVLGHLHLRFEGWVPLCRRAFDGCEAVLGPQHADTLVAAATLAELRQAQGKLEPEVPPLEAQVSLSSDDDDIAIAPDANEDMGC